MQEEVALDGDRIRVQGQVAAGDYVRTRGSDLALGQKIVTRSQRLSAATLALLAAQGVPEVQTGTPARVAIVSTGDAWSQQVRFFGRARFTRAIRFC